MGKKCDLCDGLARMYCESDQASLCFDCDGKVHGANFLVAKHTRCLLCSACQSPTPWKASGLRLGPTLSACDSCIALKTNRSLTENRGQGVNGADYEEDQIREDDGAESYDDDEDEDEDDDDEYSDEDEDEEAENQVVPWAAAAQPPLVISPSSSDGGGGDLVTKRTRDYFADEIGCSEAQESNYSRPLKRPSREEPAFKSTDVMNSRIRLERDNIELRR